MQSVSSRVWTRVAVSISYDDNHYTTEWVITKTVVVNGIEILIILTKYDTRQRREEGTHC